MTLQEIVRDLAQHLKLTQKVAREVLLRVESKITEGLLSDGMVRLGELGVFEVKERKARQGRNPRTKATVLIPRKTAVVFRPAHALKKHLAEAPEEARRVASSLLQDMLSKNDSAGRCLSPECYSHLARQAGAASSEWVWYPQDKDKVAQALRNELGGDFQRFEIPPDAWTRSGPLRFRVSLWSDTERTRFLTLGREEREWKVVSISDR
jgi:DNA-binding protein HU-beta